MPSPAGLHRVAAGLAPDAPGYARLRIAPQPLPGLTWANARHETPYGTAEAGWRRDGTTVVVSALVPTGVSAVVRLPDGRHLEVGPGSHKWTCRVPGDPAPERIATSTSLATIIDDPVAYRAVMDTLARIDPGVARDFRRRMKWVPNQPLFGAFSLVSPAVIAEVESGLEALNGARGL